MLHPLQQRQLLLQVHRAQGVPLLDDGSEPEIHVQLHWGPSSDTRLSSGRVKRSVNPQWGTQQPYLMARQRRNLIGSTDESHVVANMPSGPGAGVWESFLLREDDLLVCGMVLTWRVVATRPDKGGWLSSSQEVVVGQAEMDLSNTDCSILNGLSKGQAALLHLPLFPPNHPSLHSNALKSGVPSRAQATARAARQPSTGEQGDVSVGGSSDGSWEPLMDSHAKAARNRFLGSARTGNARPRSVLVEPEPGPAGLLVVSAWLQDTWAHNNLLGPGLPPDLQPSFCLSLSHLPPGAALHCPVAASYCEPCVVYLRIRLIGVWGLVNKGSTAGGTAGQSTSSQASTKGRVVGITARTSSSGSSVVKAKAEKLKAVAKSSEVVKQAKEVGMQLQAQGEQLLQQGVQWLNKFKVPKKKGIFSKGIRAMEALAGTSSSSLKPTPSGNATFTAGFAREGSMGVAMADNPSRRSSMADDEKRRVGAAIGAELNSQASVASVEIPDTTSLYSMPRCGSSSLPADDSRQQQQQQQQYGKTQLVGVNSISSQPVSRQGTSMSLGGGLPGDESLRSRVVVSSGPSGSTAHVLNALEDAGFAAPGDTAATDAAFCWIKVNFEGQEHTTCMAKVTATAPNKHQQQQPKQDMSSHGVAVPSPFSCPDVDTAEQGEDGATQPALPRSGTLPKQANGYKFKKHLPAAHGQHAAAAAARKFGQPTYSAAWTTDEPPVLLAATRPLQTSPSPLTTGGSTNSQNKQGPPQVELELWTTKDMKSRGRSIAKLHASLAQLLEAANATRPPHTADGATGGGPDTTSQSQSSSCVPRPPQHGHVLQKAAKLINMGGVPEHMNPSSWPQGDLLLQGRAEGGAPVAVSLYVEVVEASPRARATGLPLIEPSTAPDLSRYKSDHQRNAHDLSAPNTPSHPLHVPSMEDVTYSERTSLQQKGGANGLLDNSATAGEQGSGVTSVQLQEALLKRSGVVVASASSLSSMDDPLGAASSQRQQRAKDAQTSARATRTGSDTSDSSSYGAASSALSVASGVPPVTSDQASTHIQRTRSVDPSEATGRDATSAVSAAQQLQGAPTAAAATTTTHAGASATMPTVDSPSLEGATAGNAQVAGPAAGTPALPRLRTPSPLSHALHDNLHNQRDGLLQDADTSDVSDTDVDASIMSLAPCVTSHAAAGKTASHHRSKHVLHRQKARREVIGDCLVAWCDVPPVKAACVPEVPLDATATAKYVNKHLFKAQALTRQRAKRAVVASGVRDTVFTRVRRNVTGFVQGRLAAIGATKSAPVIPELRVVGHLDFLIHNVSLAAPSVAAGTMTASAAATNVAEMITGKGTDYYLIMKCGDHWVVTGTRAVVAGGAAATWGLATRIPLTHPSTPLQLALLKATGSSVNAETIRKGVRSMMMGINLSQSGDSVTGRLRLRPSQLRPGVLHVACSLPLLGERIQSRGPGVVATCVASCMVTYNQLLPLIMTYIQPPTYGPVQLLQMGCVAGDDVCSPYLGHEELAVSDDLVQRRQRRAVLGWLSGPSVAPGLSHRTAKRVLDDGRQEFTLSRTLANWRRLQAAAAAFTFPVGGWWKTVQSWRRPGLSISVAICIILFGIWPSQMIALGALLGAASLLHIKAHMGRSCGMPPIMIDDNALDEERMTVPVCSQALLSTLSNNIAVEGTGGWFTSDPEGMLLNRILLDAASAAGGAGGGGHSGGYAGGAGQVVMSDSGYLDNPSLATTSPDASSEGARHGGITGNNNINNSSSIPGTGSSAPLVVPSSSGNAAAGGGVTSPTGSRAEHASIPPAALDVGFWGMPTNSPPAQEYGYMSAPVTARGQQQQQAQHTASSSQLQTAGSRDVSLSGSAAPGGNAAASAHDALQRAVSPGRSRLSHSSTAPGGIAAVHANQQQQSGVFGGVTGAGEGSRAGSTTPVPRLREQQSYNPQQNPHGSQSPQRYGTASAGQGAGSNMATNLAAAVAVAVPMDPLTALRGQYDSLVKFVLTVQNIMDAIASTAERIAALLTWSDPIATALLLASLIVIAAAVWFLGLPVIIAAGLLFDMRPPAFREPLPPPPLNLVSYLPCRADHMT